jgi:hypothetical protein
MVKNMIIMLVIITVVVAAYYLMFAKKTETFVDSDGNVVTAKLIRWGGVKEAAIQNTASKATMKQQ